MPPPRIEIPTGHDVRFCIETIDLATRFVARLGMHQGAQLAAIRGELERILSETNDPDDRKALGLLIDMIGIFDD